MSRKTTIPTAAFAAVLAAALPMTLAAAPALAQVQQGNPNAANQSMSTMSTNRSVQQDSISQSNTTRMNLERSQTAPAAPAAPTPIPHAGAPGR